MTAHARLSASAAHRWLACPGSVNLGGKNTTSAYAAEGTFAHSIAAKCLEDSSLSASDFLLKQDVIDGHPVECGLEMVEAVNVYLDEVAADLKEGDLCWVEMPLLKALSAIDKDLGGTADYVRYRPIDKTLRVFDFKYGSGTYVEADSNEQLKIYALGAMLEVKAPIVEVEVTIVQPRFEGARPVRSWKFPAIEILEFAASIEDAAKLSRQPFAPLAAGDHCKFCPGAAVCPELERKQHALVAAEFDFLGAYEPSRLAAALASIPLVKERIKAIEEFAYQEASAGKEIPGFKLVDKRPVRKWKSEGDVIEWAQAQAIDPYAPRELLSPAQMEKKLGAEAPRGKKKEAGKVLEPFVEKVSSGTALVPVADDRPPAKLVTAEDFAVIAGTADKN